MEGEARHDESIKPSLSLAFPIHQMKLKTDSVFGNFAFAIEAEVGEKEVQLLASYGLLQIAQRSPASAAEKAMAGYEKRPTGFKRDSIAYGESAAAILREKLSAIPLDGNGTITCSVTVTEYVPAADATQTKVDVEIAGRHESAGDLESWLAATCKYSGPTHENDEYAPAMLAAIRAVRREREAQVLAQMKGL